MKRNNLDEMQEQKLLKVESRGLWLAYWLLIVVIIGQILWTGSLESSAGELIVLFSMCVYIVAGCLRHGVWDRRLKPNFKTNLIGSILAGVVTAVVQVLFIVRNGWGGDWLTLWAAPLFVGLFTAGLCFVALSFSSAIYKKRHEKLEKE